MFKIDFTYSPWLLIVFALISFGITYLMYAKTSVEIPLWLKRTLLGIRFIIIFLILLLFIEPLLTAVSEIKHPPTIVVLQDNSQSIGASKDSTFIKNDYKNVLSQFIGKLKESKLNIETLAFGNEVNSFSIDSLQLNAAGTNISNAFETISEKYATKNLSGIVLLSDGISTVGKSPLYSLDNLTVPIFTALLGDTSETKDVLIESVLYNEISYLNTITPIRVNIRSVGIKNETVTVNLLQDGVAIGTQNVTLSNNIATNFVEFQTKLDKVGYRQFSVQVTNLPNELTYKNNSQYFFINVLETRLKIALFAGGPHPDIAVISRALASDDRFKIDQYIRKNDSEFYISPNLNDLRSYNLFILHNFPNSSADKQILDKIYSEVETRQAPLFQIVGNQTKLNIHPRQKEFMALTTERQNANTSEAFLYFSPEYKTHATYRFDDDKSFDRLVETAPPLLRYDADWKPKAGAQVYGKAKIKGIPLDYPIFALWEKGGQKNVTFVGEGLWRFRIHNYVEKENFELFDQWLNNLSQWLTTKTDNRKFRVYPVKNIFDGDEHVIFKGQVYDDAYKPLSDVDIKLTLNTNDGKKTDYYLNEVQPGAYTLDLGIMANSAYSYNASGTKKAQNIGTDAGQFSVQPSTLEFINLRADKNQMEQIAKRTEGAFVFARNLNQLANEIVKRENIKPIIEYKKATHPLQKYLLPIIIILTLLSFEWIIRKRYGLI